MHNAQSFADAAASTVAVSVPFNARAFTAHKHTRTCSHEWWWWVRLKRVAAINARLCHFMKIIILLFIRGFIFILIYKNFWYIWIRFWLTAPREPCPVTLLVCILLLAVFCYQLVVKHRVSDKIITNQNEKKSVNRKITSAMWTMAMGNVCNVVWPVSNR